MRLQQLAWGRSLVFLNVSDRQNYSLSGSCWLLLPSSGIFAILPRFVSSADSVRRRSVPPSYLVKAGDPVYLM